MECCTTHWWGSRFSFFVALYCSCLEFNALLVVYFDQLLGAARTQKLVNTFFSVVYFILEITERGLK